MRSIYCSRMSSPIGELTIAATQDAVIGLWIQGQKYFLSRISEEEIIWEACGIHQIAERWLEAYFSGKNPAISDIPLKPSGSTFQNEVWNILKQIPYGQTMTYGEISHILARNEGKKCMSAQAIGQAVGHNPISIIIPCHRVVGSNGSLTGYAGGVNIKKWLLELEGLSIDSSSWKLMRLPHL